jgi:hypothetical protein
MTNTSDVIACNLSEPDLRKRKDMLRSMLSPFLTQATFAAGTSRLAFSKPDVTRKMLEDMILLERECCPFFSFDLSETNSDFQLNVTGPEGSDDMVRNLFSTNNNATCSCATSDKSFTSKKNYVFGFITLCAVGCAALPTLAALGLIGVATGAYVGMWAEVVAVFAVVLGVGYLLAPYVRKKRREGS